MYGMYGMPGVRLMSPLQLTQWERDGCLLVRRLLTSADAAAAGTWADEVMAGAAEVKADCICIVYLCVPVCVIEGGGGARPTKA